MPCAGADGIPALVAAPKPQRSGVMLPAKESGFGDRRETPSPAPVVPTQGGLAYRPSGRQSRTGGAPARSASTAFTASASPIPPVDPERQHGPGGVAPVVQCEAVPVTSCAVRAFNEHVRVARDSRRSSYVAGSVPWARSPEWSNHGPAGCGPSALIRSNNPSSHSCHTHFTNRASYRGRSDGHSPFSRLIPWSSATHAA